MGPTMYLYEKAREVHYQDLRCEMEARRMLSYLPQYHRRMSRHVAVLFGRLLIRARRLAEAVRTAT